jgi:hypothetical protein
MAGITLQIHCIMQITLNKTLQHVATPRLRADTEKPERQLTLLQRPSQPHFAAALVYTIERHSRTHKAVSNNHTIGLSRNTYSAREQSTAINLLNEIEERQQASPETVTPHRRTMYTSQLESAIASAPIYRPKSNSAHQIILIYHSRSASFSAIRQKASRN